jgi:hypothetical protein
MPAPPSRAQTDAKNAAQKSNSVSPAGGKGGTSSGSKSSSSSGGMKSGPGATGGAKTATSTKSNAQTKTQSSSTKQSQTAGRVPGASAAASKANAFGKVAQQASRNVSPSVRNPVSLSGKADAGLYGRFTPSLPSMKPGASVMGSPVSRQALAPGGWMNMQRAPGGYRSAFANAAGVDAGVNWSGSFGNIPALRNLSPQGESLYRALEDTALRTNQPVTVFSGGRFGGKPNHRTGNALDQYMRDPVSGRPVGESVIGSAAKFPIARRANPAIENTLAGPYRDFAGAVFDTAFQNPGVYPGVAERIRYGGTFGGSVPKDYMHFDVTPGASMGTQGTLRKEAANRARQGTLSGGTMLAGGGVPAGAMSAERVAQVQGPSAPVQMASAAIGSIPKPRPRPALAPVPRPTPRPDSFPRGFGDTGIGRTVNPYSAPTFNGFGDTGVGRTVNPYSPPVPVPTARPDSFPRGFGDQGMGRPVNPYSAPVSPFSDAGIRRPVTPFAGQPAASIVPPIPKARPPMQGPQRPIGGMSFTPGLPGPQKAYYDRVASTDGFVPSAMVKDQTRIAPDYPGAQPAGTYTTPYDAPRMSPFGNVGQEFHRHQAPPTPSQYRNEMPPAAPNQGTPASQTAQTETEPSFWEKTGDMFNQASTAVTEKLAENKKIVEEVEKKYGKLTPAKVKMWSWLNGLGGGTGTGSLPQGRGGNGGDIRSPSVMPPPVQQAEQQPEPSQSELIALLEAMRQKGATPEEIAFVESLVTPTA